MLSKGRIFCLIVGLFIVLTVPTLAGGFNVGLSEWLTTNEIFGVEGPVNMTEVFVGYQFSEKWEASLGYAFGVGKEYDLLTDLEAKYRMVSSEVSYNLAPFTICAGFFNSGAEYIDGPEIIEPERLSGLYAGLSVDKAFTDRLSGFASLRYAPSVLAEYNNTVYTSVNTHIMLPAEPTENQGPVTNLNIGVDYLVGSFMLTGGYRSDSYKVKNYIQDQLSFSGLYLGVKASF